MNDDCWNEVLSHCDNIELVKISLTSGNLNKLVDQFWSKRFFNLTKYNSVDFNYQYLCFLIYEQEPEELEQLLSQCFKNQSYIDAKELTISTDRIIDMLSCESYPDIGQIEVDDIDFERRYTNPFIERFQDNICSLELNQIMIKNKVLITKLEEIDLNVTSLEFNCYKVEYGLENGLLGRGCFNDSVSDYLLNNLYKMKKLRKLSVIEYSRYYFLVYRPKLLTHLCVGHLGVDFKFLDGIEYLELPVLADCDIERLKELPKSIKHVKFEKAYLREYYDFDFHFEISIGNSELL